MKIIYDNVSPDFSFPLSRKDIRVLKEILPLGIYEKINVLEFGCNRKTTQLGRTVQLANGVYNIRVNFCLKNFTSIVLSEGHYYIEPVEQCGGVIDLTTRLVQWTSLSAKKFGFFILLHEIGHICYAEHILERQSWEKKAGGNEEKWCDNFARDNLTKITFENNGAIRGLKKKEVPAKKFPKEKSEGKGRYRGT